MFLGRPRSLPTTPTERGLNMRCHTASCCPRGVVVYHEALSMLRPGFKSRRGRLTGAIKRFLRFISKIFFKFKIKKSPHQERTPDEGENPLGCINLIHRQFHSFSGMNCPIAVDPSAKDIAAPAIRSPLAISESPSGSIKYHIRRPRSIKPPAPQEITFWPISGI